MSKKDKLTKLMPKYLVNILVKYKQDRNGLIG